MSATFTTSEYLLGTDIISNVDAFSMWAWVRWTNVTGYRTLGGQQDAAAWGCKDGEMYLGTSSSDHMSGDTISTNTWYHCVWTVNGNAHLLYLNNVVALSVSDAASNNDLLIGGWGGTGGEFAGQLGPWGFINGTVLTADQVAALYRGGRRPRGIPTPTFWNPGFDGANPQTNWVPGGTGLTRTGTTVASAEEPNVVWQRQGAIYALGGSAGAFTLTADTASLGITGNATGLTAQRLLTAATATLGITGNAAGLNRGYPLIAASAALGITGNAATLTAQRRLTADPATLTLTGNDATLTHGSTNAYTLTADGASFTLTGNAAALLAARKLTADTTNLALTGNAAALFRGFPLLAAAATLGITGNAATLTAQRRLLAESLTLDLNGISAGLIYSGAPPENDNFQPVIRRSGSRRGVR